MNVEKFKEAMFMIIYARLICSWSCAWTSNNRTFLIYTISSLRRNPESKLSSCTNLKDLSILNLPNFKSIEEKVDLAIEISSLLGTAVLGLFLCSCLY